MNGLSLLCVHVNDRIKCVYLDYVSDFMDFHGFWWFSSCLVKILWSEHNRINASLWRYFRKIKFSDETTKILFIVKVNVVKIHVVLWTF